MPFILLKASSMGFSMRRHILSRANAVALERQLAQTKPLGAVFLFALRLSQSKVTRCSMGSVRDRRCHFRFGLLTRDGGHTPYRSRLRIERRAFGLSLCRLCQL